MQKTFRSYFFLLMIAFGLSTQCFAAQNMKTTCDQSQSFDNYYVQPGGVYVAPNGIFVLLEGELIQVNVLCSDENGIFVPASEMSRRLVQCPFCRNWYDPSSPAPHRCPGPR